MLKRWTIFISIFGAVAVAALVVTAVLLVGDAKTGTSGSNGGAGTDEVAADGISAEAENTEAGASKAADGASGDGAPGVADKAAGDGTSSVADKAAGEGADARSAEGERVAPEKSRHLVLIGDSRTVGMYWALTGSKDLHEVQLVEDDDTVWSCKEGIGLDWMKESGVPFTAPYIDGDADVVILMGVNDIGGAYSSTDYCVYLNEMGITWTDAGAEVYYVSVNPVDGALANGLSNERIDAWNREMQDGLGEAFYYIDTNAQINDHINFKDQLHYKDDTNLEIYQLIRDACREK